MTAAIIYVLAAVGALAVLFVAWVQLQPIELAMRRAWRTWRYRIR